MSSSEAAVIAHKAASAAIYGGSGTAMYFGLSPGEWQVVGVLGGLVFAAAGFVTNLYFKHQHFLLAKKRMFGDEG
jgi:allophanate hydrolase subunit 1